MELQLAEPETNLERIQVILEEGKKENPQLQKVEEAKLTKLIASSLQEVAQLEQLAREHRRILIEGKIPIPAESLAKLKALWVLSGPGLYRQAFKDDRYRDKPWAAFMGRHRLTYAGLLTRRLAEAKPGAPYDHLQKGRITPLKSVIRNRILAAAPIILFNGREDENLDVRSIVSEDGKVIPPEKVWISGKSIDKTIDQVNSLTLPPDLKLNPGDEIGIITHAPHFMRFAHMLNRFSDKLPISPEVTIRAFPLPSPPNSQEYTDQEIRGLLYYVFITGEATKESYPYVI